MPARSLSCGRKRWCEGQYGAGCGEMRGIAIYNLRLYIAAMPRLSVLLWYASMIAIAVWVVYQWLLLGGAKIVFTFLALFGVYLVWIDLLSPNRG